MSRPTGNHSLGFGLLRSAAWRVVVGGDMSRRQSPPHPPDAPAAMPTHRPGDWPEPTCLPDPTLPQVVQRWLNAWAEGDLSALASASSPDLQICDNGVSIVGLADVVSTVAKRRGRRLGAPTVTAVQRHPAEHLVRVVHSQATGEVPDVALYRLQVRAESVTRVDIEPTRPFSVAAVAVSNSAPGAARAST